MRILRLLVLVFAVALALFLFGAGRFLEAPTPLQTADLVAVLGGERCHDHSRRALELLREGRSRTGLVLVNSPASARFLRRNGVAPERILFMREAANTMEELRAVRRFLDDHRLHSALVVSSPPHLRRIRILGAMAGFGEKGPRLFVAGSHPSWWRADRWYANPISRRFVLSEFLKIPYNLFKYGLLEPLGLLPRAEPALARLKRRTLRLIGRL